MVAGVESYLKFLLLLSKLSFSDTTVIEGGRERKTQLRSQVFYSGRHVTVNNTPA